MSPPEPSRNAALPKIKIVNTWKGVHNGLSTLDETGTGAYFFRDDKFAWKKAFRHINFASGTKTKLSSGEPPDIYRVSKSVSNIQSTFNKREEFVLLFAFIHEMMNRVFLMTFRPDLAARTVTFEQEREIEQIGHAMAFAVWLKSDVNEMYLFKWLCMPEKSVYSVTKASFNDDNELQCNELNASKVVNGRWLMPFIVKDELAFVSYDTPHNQLKLISLDGQEESDQSLGTFAQEDVDLTEIKDCFVSCVYTNGTGNSVFFIGYNETVKNYAVFALDLDVFRWKSLGHFTVDQKIDGKFCNFLPISDQNGLVFHGNCSNGRKRSLAYAVEIENLSALLQERPPIRKIAEIREHLRQARRAPGAAGPMVLRHGSLTIADADRLQEKIAEPVAKLQKLIDDFTEKCTKLMCEFEEPAAVNEIDASSVIGKTQDIIKQYDNLKSQLDAQLTVLDNSDSSLNKNLLQLLSFRLQKSKDATFENATFILTEQATFAGRMSNAQILQINAMEENALKNHMMDISTSMDTQKILDHLQTNEILKPDELDVINSMSNDVDKNVALLNATKNGGQPAFSAFMQALRDTDQGQLADLLENDLARNVDGANKQSQDQIKHLLQRIKFDKEERARKEIQQAADISRLEAENKHLKEKIDNMEEVEKIVSRETEKQIQLLEDNIEECNLKLAEGKQQNVEMEKRVRFLEENLLSVEKQRDDLLTKEKAREERRKQKEKLRDTVRES